MCNRPHLSVTVSLKSKYFLPPRQTLCIPQRKSPSSNIHNKQTVKLVTMCLNSLINSGNYTECPRRNVPDFGRLFLMLKYTDITQNTYIQSWTVTEIMAREKLGLLAVPNTATCTVDTSRDKSSVLESGMQCSLCLRDALRSQPCYVTAGLSHV